MLGAMFSGRYDPGPKDKEGRYFIDRPPSQFQIILDCLRTDSKITWPEDENELKKLKTEVEFYGMKDFFKSFGKPKKLLKKKNLKKLIPLLLLHQMKMKKKKKILKKKKKKILKKKKKMKKKLVNYFGMSHFLIQVF